MSIAKRLLEEKMDLTCSECGEEFPEYLRNALIAKGMREAAEFTKVENLELRRVIKQMQMCREAALLRAKEAILARAKELEGPHGELLTDWEPNR